MTGIWTIGREREKEHAIKYIRNVNEHPLIFDVIDAVQDIKAGDGDLQLFMNAAIHAFVNGGRAVWGQTANWVRKMGKHHPQVHVIWDELAKWSISEVRWRVACVLYHDIPERQSHYLFDRLRSDKSKRVRQIAISRYEYTTDAKGLAERTRSAGEFDLARAIAELDARGYPKRPTDEQ